jgi:diguanylate cyclase (GGDEF)-like protein/PAS domain S-box-containing protein
MAESSLVFTIHTYVGLFLIFIIILFFSKLMKQNKTLKNEKIKFDEIKRQLEESELLFRTVFEQAPLGISIGDSDEYAKEFSSKFQPVNKMYEKILGRSNEDLAGMDWESVTHPDDIENDASQLKRLLAHEIDNYSIEKRYIKPDGTYTWVNMVMARLDLDNSTAQNRMCIVQDITDKKIAEESLRESERSKAVLLSHLPGTAYRCLPDKTRTMQFMSDGCFKLTGYYPEDFMNNRKLSYCDLITPEHKNIVWNEWERVQTLKTTFRYEYEIVSASGECKWVSELGQSIYDEDGRIEALEGIIFDITDRKTREEEFKYLSEHDFLTELYNRKYFDDEKSRLDNMNDCLPVTVMIVNINGMRLINDAFGYDEGDQVIKETAKIIENCCRKSDIIARTAGDEFSIIMKNTSSYDGAYVQKKLYNCCEAHNKKINDRTFDISISCGISTKENADESIDKALKEAIEVMHNSKLLNNKSSHSAILSSIMATMYERSHETEEHAKRIAFISRKIGENMNLPPNVLDELELFSMLHDIGKIGIDDRILNKPGKLNDIESFIMKKHPEIGYRIAMSSPELEPVAEYILYHHEKWDGSGYPKGLKGENIPLLSRILAVSDAFDAMTEDRIYRKAMSVDDAIAEIRIKSGIQFDPHVVEVFIENYNQIENNTKAVNA